MEMIMKYIFNIQLLVNYFLFFWRVGGQNFLYSLNKKKNDLIQFDKTNEHLSSREVNVNYLKEYSNTNFSQDDSTCIPQPSNYFFGVNS